MIRHGVAPFLECSTRGDKRFSAFCAMIDGKSIEQWYQEKKRFDCDVSNLTWREKQGLPCENPEECHQYYADLWDEYILRNLHLLPVLVEATGLSDVFGKAGHACQATELWDIRRLHIEGSFP